MASPQAENGHVRIANELYDQIMMRNFTKRQRAILDLVIRMSFGCGKKQAYIPKLAYFEICGVHRKIVSPELRGLRNFKVLDWDEVTRCYWLNKDYDEWLIGHPENSAFNSFAELLKANLHLKGHQQNIGNDHQNDGETQQNNDVSVNTDQQNIDEVTNKTLVGAPIKHWCEEPEIPGGEKAEGASINSIKNRDNKDKEIVSINRAPRMFEDYHLPIMKYGRPLFPQTDGISQGVSHDLAEMLFKNKLPVELAYRALDVTKELHKTEGFAKNKLRGWLQAGVTNTDAAIRYEIEVFGSKGSDGGVEIATTRRATPEFRREDGKSVENFLKQRLQQQGESDELLRVSDV